MSIKKHQVDGTEIVTTDTEDLTLGKTQTADNQESLEINHDFDDNQGAIIKITGDNTGSGTADGERLIVSEATITKKIPTTYLYYVTGTPNRLFKKQGGTWSEVFHGLPDVRLDHVSGLAVDSIWLGGTNLSYYDGVSWQEDPSFTSSHGSVDRVQRVYPISSSEIYVRGIDDAGSTDPTYLIRGDGFNGTWTTLDGPQGVHWSWHREPGANTMAKVGTKFIYALTNTLRITQDVSVGSPTWVTDSSIDTWRIAVAADPANNRFIVCAEGDWIIGNRKQFRFYYGDGTVNDWTLFAEYVQDSTYGVSIKHLEVDALGNIFAIAQGQSPTYVFLYDIESGTPSVVTSDSAPQKGFVLSANHVLVADGLYNRIRIWNGVSLQDEPLGFSNTTTSVWGIENPTGTATFGGHKISFSGQDIPNEAIAYEVGAGATHALKATSGDVELDAGIIILGEQSETPATPTNKGVIYTKEVSGETEAFYLGTDGNEIQLTSGGKVIAEILKESGGQALTMDAVADGQFLKRNGTLVIGASRREEEFSTTGGETPGTVVALGPLTGTPIVASNMKSGFDLQVFYNGVKMKYRTPAPLAENEYFYDSANKEIDIYATGTVIDYEIVYVE